MGIFLLIVTLGPSALAAPEKNWFDRAKLPVPRLETLKNGMVVAWFVNKSLPLIDLALLVQAGYRDDLKGKSGTAQLVSSTLLRGSKGKSAKEVAFAVEKLGATRYVSADEDTFTVGVHGLASDGIALLDYLAEVVRHPDFQQKEFDREQLRILDRWKHLGDKADDLATLAFHRLIASGTVYARGGFLSQREFKKIVRTDVTNYYDSHFHPKNAVLMVVGRVDPVKFKKEILARFGNWKSTPTQTGKKPKPYQFVNRKIRLGKSKGILVERKDLTQAQIRMGFRAPLINAKDHYELVVANAILGEYFNSRLNSTIRDKLALTYAIGSQFSYSQNLSIFTISTACRNKVVGQLLETVHKIVKDFVDGGVRPEEVRMAKEYLIGSFPLSTSTLSSVASRWLAGYIYQLGPNYLNEFIPRVNDVNVEGVEAAIRKHFNPKKLRTVVAGDPKSIRTSLKSKGFWPFKRVRVKDLE